MFFGVSVTAKNSTVIAEEEKEGPVDSSKNLVFLRKRDYF
jgi:hypothetical protein